MPQLSPTGVRPAGASLKLKLLCVWAIASFGVVFFARDLDVLVAGWPLHFWYAGQGAIVVYILVIVYYARQRNRAEAPDAAAAGVPASDHGAGYHHRRFMMYVLCLLAFLLAMGMAERAGLPKAWIGGIFLFSTLTLYAGIGIYCRTMNPLEYYVAGRRVPAMYNGMATAADWMSAASFISLAGGLYLQGFSGTDAQPGGLAYVLGWTGGFCLVALLVAPRLRRMELFTLPDFFAVRYGGVWPRRLAAVFAVLCSFTYLVAQIYGVGLIASRLTGVQFEIGVMLGLGGVLVCSFLGGMRAITWTQVAQYVVLILAFLIPVCWLAFKQLGNPAALLVYGQQLEKISIMEKELLASPAEMEVVAEYARRAADYSLKLRDVESALAAERAAAVAKLERLKAGQSDMQGIQAAARELAFVPKTVDAARDRWSRALQDNLERARPLGAMLPHQQAFAGNPEGSQAEQHAFQVSRSNFLALMFCLMVGTAGLPHLLTRYYTTPSVSETRSSVAWSIVFIALLYVSAPALAVLVKFEVISNLVGQRFDALPNWIAQWAKIDPTLVSVTDLNGDGILQFAELKLGADLVMLVTPELGGLPYVVSGLVAAGGLAAALSTADGLLLTISNALAHDLYFEGTNQRAGSVHGVILAKFALLLVAIGAAFVASQKPAEILSLVAASFSLAAASFFPAMVLGMYWQGTTRRAAIVGMVLGFSVTLYYTLGTLPAIRHWLGWSGNGLWFDIQPVSAGVFGVPAGAAAIVLISLVSRARA